MCGSSWGVAIEGGAHSAAHKRNRSLYAAFNCAGIFPAGVKAKWLISRTKAAKAKVVKAKAVNRTKAANKVAVIRSPASRDRSLVRAVNRAAVASRNPANSSKSPDAKADNRKSVKYYCSVRSLSPRFSRGIFLLDCNAQ